MGFSRTSLAKPKAVVSSTLRSVPPFVVLVLVLRVQIPCADEMPTVSLVSRTAMRPYSQDVGQKLLERSGCLDIVLAIHPLATVVVARQSSPELRM